MGQEDNTKTTEDIPIYLTLEELNDVLQHLPGQDNISQTLSDPLCKCIVHMGVSYNQILDHNKSPADRIQIPDLGQAFQDHVTINQATLKEEIDRSNKTKTCTRLVILHV